MISPFLPASPPHWAISLYYPCFLIFVLYFLLLFFCVIFDNFLKSVLGNLLSGLPIHFLILMKIFSICASFI